MTSLGAIQAELQRLHDLLDRVDADTAALQEAGQRAQAAAEPTDSTPQEAWPHARPGGRARLELSTAS